MRLHLAFGYCIRRQAQSLGDLLCLMRDLIQLKRAATNGMFAVPLLGGATPLWTLRNRQVFVPDALRHCVVFIGIKKEDGSFIPEATGFLAAAEDGRKLIRTHLITAEHVIPYIRDKITKPETKGVLAARLNTSSGGSEIIDLTGAHWWSHPDVANLSDVAVTPFSFVEDQYDQVALLLVNRDASDEIVRAEGGALGQEVLIVGLFRHHTGARRNEPIIRVGNLSAMPTEPLKTEYAGRVEGYLVEARSIWGLSGSPVLLNLMDVHSSEVKVTGQDWANAKAAKALGPKDKVWIADEKGNEGVRAALAELRPDNVVDLGRYRLLGLMQGHWDLPDTDAAVTEGAGKRKESVNVGIGVVVPIRKILETLYQEELVQERARLEADERQNSTAPYNEPQARQPAKKTLSAQSTMLAGFAAIGLAVALGIFLLFR
jgi:hypothetical protein